MSIKLTGLNDLKQSLSDLDADLENILESALIEAGGCIQQSAVDHIRSNGSVDTGNMMSAANLRVERAPDDNGKMVVNVVADATATNGAPYPVYIEYGTGLYAEGGNGRKTPWTWKGAGGKYSGFHRTYGMPAKPFMRPAFNENRQEAVDIVKEYVSDALEARR